MFPLSLFVVVSLTIDVSRFAQTGPLPIEDRPPVGPNPNPNPNPNRRLQHQGGPVIDVVQRDVQLAKRAPRDIWRGVKTNGIPFWLGLVNSPPILEPILVGIGMFTGGTQF